MSKCGHNLFSVKPMSRCKAGPSLLRPDSEQHARELLCCTHRQAATEHGMPLSPSHSYWIGVGVVCLFP